MAYDDEITSLYRIIGISSIGTPNVFPRTRVVRKVKKSAVLEKKPREETGEGKGIDIKV